MLSFAATQSACSSAIVVNVSSHLKMKWMACKRVVLSFECTLHSWKMNDDMFLEGGTKTTTTTMHRNPSLFLHLTWLDLNFLPAAAAFVSPARPSSSSWCNSSSEKVKSVISLSRLSLCTALFFFLPQHFTVHCKGKTTTPIRKKMPTMR